MNTILAFLLLVGLFVVYVLSNRRKISDGKALFWSAVCEPVFYISGDPFDESVTGRAANARQKLDEHGNKHLTQNDVWEYCYSATPETPTRDFSMWQDWAQQDVLKRREAWRQQKTQWNMEAAKQAFSGQTIFTQHNQS